MPVQIAAQEAEIARVRKITRSLPPGPLKRDTLKYLRRLQNELAECKMYLAKGGQKNAGYRS